MWANMDNHLGLPDGIYVHFIIAFDCKRIHVMNNPAVFLRFTTKEFVTTIIVIVVVVVVV